MLNGPAKGGWALAAEPTAHAAPSGRTATADREGARCGGTTTACQAPPTKWRLSPTGGELPGTWENPTAQTSAPAALIP